MFEVIRSGGAVEAAAAFQCEGAGFIEKYRPFSYEQDCLVIRGGCCIKVGKGSNAVLAVNREDFVFDPAPLLDVAGPFEVGCDYFSTSVWTASRLSLSFPGTGHAPTAPQMKTAG